MTFPLAYLLYIYFGFLGLWSIFSLIAIFHMVKYGAATFKSYLFTFLYIVVSIIILTSSTNYIQKIDWQTNVVLDSFGFSSNLIEQ